MLLAALGHVWRKFLETNDIEVVAEEAYFDEKSTA